MRQYFNNIYQVVHEESASPYQVISEIKYNNGSYQQT